MEKKTQCWPNGTKRKRKTRVICSSSGFGGSRCTGGVRRLVGRWGCAGKGVTWRKKSSAGRKVRLWAGRTRGQGCHTDLQQLPAGPWPLAPPPRPRGFYLAVRVGARPPPRSRGGDFLQRDWAGNTNWGALAMAGVQGACPARRHPRPRRVPLPEGLICTGIGLQRNRR